METPNPPIPNVPPVPPEAPKKPNTGLIVGLVVGVLGLGGCAVIAILAAILFPVFGEAKLAAQATAGLSNAKQCATGMLIYATDFDDRLPLRDRWMDSIGKFVGTRTEDGSTSKAARSEAVFRSPALRQTQPDAYGYAFNEDLVAKNLAELKNPESTPMVFDSTVTTRNATAPTSTMPSPGRYRRGGTTKNAVAYADTSAKLVEAK